MLDPAAATIATDIFGAAVLEGYPTTDVGHIAHQAPGDRGLYINDDLLIVEPVDEHDRLIEPGEWSDHLLVTSLYHRTLPLIRYRIEDRVQLDPEPGQRHPAFRRIAAIDGRTDDLFRYGDDTVHPHVFRAVLSQHIGVRDFQVHQTPTGADVQVVATGQLDLHPIAAALEHALERSGLTHPQVTVTRVDQPTRTAVGKRLRFVPETPTLRRLNEHRPERPGPRRLRRRQDLHVAPHHDGDAGFGPGVRRPSSRSGKRPPPEPVSPPEPVPPPEPMRPPIARSGGT